MEKAIKDILVNGVIKVNGSLWLESNGKRFFGPGPVELLEFIQETGSINQAAKKMKMSYKKAWELINNLNGMSAAPLVVTSTGGDNGGGSTISEEARQLIAYHRELRVRFKKFLEDETQRIQ
ncbi:winged helix-turn-helix domain-containing protein [Chitinophaga rhizophila]|uniref:LysR family transcriptional regulator n=1 Tax=Chitinophaga rhizophila TaxID=2866212 RepID=A0ABS7GH36_9BACT|nr:LysR family transcriptional regulator [Chitinophaga rhizophila]MBW8687004.1 LysR family transcriptional regulator [Chitinophaga rhizophila]